MTKNTLNLTEIFCSVQGETSLSGLPTTFIRLSSCNLRCSWCDTPYSFAKGDPQTLDTIFETVQKHGARHICITGGEPLLQKNVLPLMSRLCDEGYTVSLETGGSLSTENIDPRVITILDIKCPGSGMSQKNAWENIVQLKAQDEVKFVIKDHLDYEWAKEICQKHNLYQRDKEVLFSPVHEILDPQVLIKWMLDDKLKARLNLQIHKWIWTPETKGV